jgi:hypothetical protein
LYVLPGSARLPHAFVTFFTIRQNIPAQEANGFLNLAKSITFVIFTPVERPTLLDNPLGAGLPVDPFQPRHGMT